MFKFYAKYLVFSYLVSKLVCKYTYMSRPFTGSRLYVISLVSKYINK